MKGLNAYKANKNAFENANSNSQVGRIASYVDAIAVRKSSFSNLLEVQKKKDDFLSSYEGRNSEEIETDITNATAFAKWNKGLEDVVTPSKLSKAIIDKDKENNKKHEEMFKDNIVSLKKKGNGSKVHMNL